MRPTSVLLSFALFFSASASTIWVRQAGTPPACSLPCLNTATNGVSLGSCTASDIACQCRSSTYVQGVVNCLATQCASHDDVVAALDYSTAYCGVQGVNTPAPGVTTPLTQLPASTTGSSSGTTSAPGAAATTSPAATTSHSGAMGSFEPHIMLGALLFAAIGVAGGL